MPTQERRKSPQSDDEGKSLKQLLHLINTPASKQQLPSLEYQCQSKRSQKWPLPQPKSGQHQHQSTESVALEKFSCKYQSQRNFTNHPQHEKFSEIFSALIKQRLCCSEWLDRAPPENILRLLTCLRIFMRDPPYQNVFYSLTGLKVLSELFEKATNSYMQYGDSPYIVDILKEMTNIFQKFVATDEQQREWLTDCDAHKGLVVLLHASDVIVLHCSLHALIGLSQSSKPRKQIGEMNCIEILLNIIQDYDSLSKKLSAKLLESLCREYQCKETVTSYDGIPILLSQLQCNNVNLLLPLIWCLVQLCEDPIASKEIRQMGGIPLILSLLDPKRKFITERTETSDGAASAGPHGRTPIDDAIWDLGMNKKSSKPSATKADELMELQYKLKSACCAALTELVMIDANAQQIAQANGIYSLGLLILPACKECSDKERKLVKNLQKNSFRALRFLFSMERNRRMFKRLFPPDLYEMFINIGHYNRELNAYRSLVEKINGLSVNVIDEISNNICETNQNKKPSRHIGDFAVFELLGSGAFGSVFKVKKRTAGHSFLAMKEINLENPAFGKNSQERDQSVGEIINEIAIIKEQMKHPNIVRYYKTFLESQRLYIVMELIEGAPLGEHFSSLKEKKETFSEDRIWNIFMQMVLALRYLHKEKGILHRDLTPNNIMLGEDDKVTITDFGLAKQKRSDCSRMTSAVGTILYWCPEIVQNHPYGERADIWALGCILYQMCTLTPPFFSDNMLTLVTKIVNADYKPVSKEKYSDRIIQTINSCICKSVEDRPDTVQLAAQIADKLLVYMDNLRVSQITMEKKLEKERRKAQRHYIEANQNMQRYHKLHLVSQERYDRLANLAGSGGAQGLKDSEVIDPALVDIQLPKCIQSESVSSGGWTSDDDEGCPSSESESRESSAGSTRGTRLLPTSLPKPPITPKTNSLERQSRNPHSAFSPLALDIPNTSRAIRDSGYSSGDPSPNNSQFGSTASSLDPTANLQVMKVRKYQRSNSTPSPNALGRTKKKPKRPNSANAPTVTISQRKVRQISDPILQLLHQLHKILYICQLPPTLYPNHRRTKVERFKRALFIHQSTTLNLKSELKKLMSGSREIIDLNLGPTESKRVSSANSVEEAASEKDKVNNQYDPDFKEAGITYEQMQTIIESLLLECGYYSVPDNAREMTSPLGPIITSELMKELETAPN